MRGYRLRSQSCLEHPVYVDFSILFENVDSTLYTLLSLGFAVRVKALLDIQEHLVNACISA
nr:MAG TPA: hypothetical protein [Caudoviricetes sp.]